MIKLGQSGIIKTSAKYAYHDDSLIGFYFENKTAGDYELIPSLWFKPLKDHLLFHSYYLDYRVTMNKTCEFIRPFTDDEKIFVSELLIFLSDYTKKIWLGIAEYIKKHNYEVHVGKCRITFPKKNVI